MSNTLTQAITCFCLGHWYEIIFLFNFDKNSFCEFKECFIFHNNKELKQITRENYDNVKFIRISNCTCSSLLPYLNDFQFYLNEEKMCYFIKSISYGFPYNI